MARGKSNDTLMERIRENYQSVILGLIVFLIAAAAIYRAISTQPKVTQQTDEVPVDEQINEEGKIVSDKYTVRQGDNLWKIAEMKYGSGYNWTDIAKANNVKSADQIETGQSLTLPQVTPMAQTVEKTSGQETQKVTISGDTYTVAKGDHLWSIAVRAYGDGYQWGTIARENKLQNPHHIEVGQKLTLPRK